MSIRVAYFPLKTSNALRRPAFSYSDSDSDNDSGFS